jgi:class 3 adenylate cyclase
MPSAAAAGERGEDVKRILVVEDVEFNRDLIVQLLEDAYQVITAADGSEGIERAARERPDLILLDVMMPVMDGFTACRLLKGNDETRMIPIVIMTALDGFEDRIKGIEAGADDFLTKPVNQRELVARIETSLRLKHALDRKLGELRRIKDHYAKFVPEAVKRLIAANPDAPELAKGERDVTVLFLDVSGYARLSEQVAPERLNALIERYFSAFLDRIQDRGGDINETAGDGFMAIFQDTDPPGHAIRAVDTTLALLGVTEALNRENRESPLAIRIGLSSGSALVGSTRFEGLRGARWTFTASGPVTNLAARLAGVADAGQILTGPETARRLDDRYRLDPVPSERLKNIGQAIDLFRVSRGESPPAPFTSPRGA